MMRKDPREETLLRELLKIEKHEDRMITAMVRLSASNERLNERLTGLTWVMLALTWITFVISIPNTLATVFGIPKISQILSVEAMTAILFVSTVGAVILVMIPGSKLSIPDLRRRLHGESRDS